LFLIVSSCSMFTGQFLSSCITPTQTNGTGTVKMLSPIFLDQKEPLACLRPHHTTVSSTLTTNCSPITAEHHWISGGALLYVYSVNDQTLRMCPRGEIDAHFLESISVLLRVFPGCLLPTLPDRLFRILSMEILHRSKGNDLSWINDR